jgi:hypothetical protein
MNANASQFFWHILKMFWGTVAVCLALIAMLRVNSLVHIWSPTPHHIERAHK